MKGLFKKVTVTRSPGACHIWDVAEAMRRMANDYHCIVTSKFNDTHIEARPGSTVAEIVEHWSQIRACNQEE